MTLAFLAEPDAWTIVGIAFCVAIVLVSVFANRNDTPRGRDGE